MDIAQARRRVGQVLVLAALVLGCAAIATAAPANAQEPCDPAYGCEPSDAAALPPQSCVTSAGTVGVGDRVSATASNVPAGTAVRFVLGGQEVATATAGGEGSTGGEDGYFEVTVTFTVPQLAPGTYELTAEGPGYSAQCSGSIQVSDTGVLGAQTTRSGQSSGGGTSLARTGAAILALVLVAVVLIVMGRLLRQAAKDRRRAAHTEAYRIHREPERAGR